MAAAVESMAYAGEVPWHGLGVQVDSNLTPKEMLVEAGLDWSVSKREIFTYDNADPDKSEDLIMAPNHSLLVRDSDNTIFGPCGPKFIPTQNEDAFTFFKKFTDAGKMTMETAGSLKDGRQIWGLAKVDESFTLPGDDRVLGNLLVSVSHEWGKSNEIRFTPIRVVCNNTLSMALADRTQPHFKMPHTRAFDADLIKTAEDALGLASNRMKEYKEAAEFLCTKKYNKDTVVSYIADLMQPKLAMQQKLLEQSKTEKTYLARATMLDEFQRAPSKVYEALEQQPGAKFVFDHKWGHDRDAAMHNAWFGARASLKTKAMTTALDYAKAA